MNKCKFVCIKIVFYILAVINYNGCNQMSVELHIKDFKLAGHVHALFVGYH